MLLIDRDPCFTCLAQEIGRVSGRCQRAAMGCCCCVSASAAAPPPASTYVGCWVTGCIGYRLFGYPFSKFSHQKIIACFVCVFFWGVWFQLFLCFPSSIGSPCQLTQNLFLWVENRIQMCERF